MPTRFWFARSALSVGLITCFVSPVTAVEKARQPATVKAPAKHEVASPKKAQQGAGNVGEPRSADGASPTTAGTLSETPRRLADGLIEYKPPAGWTEAVKSATPMRNAFVSEDRMTMMSIEVLPSDVYVEKSAAGEIVRKMRQNRATNRQKYVEQPKAEQDNRFVLKIRERYEIKDKIADQLHLYRNVGRRTVLVVINSLAGAEQTTAYHELGEAVSLSATGVAKKK